jgi:hypothetical protein
VQHTGTSPGATFFRGSKPIDGLWVSNDLDINNACMMPFGYGIGDPQAFILDIPIESLVGENSVKIVRPTGRQLNSRLPGCSQAYIKSLEGNIRGHQLLEQLYNAHTGCYSADERVQRVIIIDEEGKAYMQWAENICRKMNAAASRFLQKRLSGYGVYKCITPSSDITEEKSRIKVT